MFFCLTKIRKQTIFWILTSLFVLIYSLSMNGADYEGYKTLYTYVSEGIRLSEIHGEIGYKFLMKIAVNVGINYTLFRILLLTCTTLALFYAIYKSSPNFALSIYFITSMFVVYTISAYRQYIVMAATIFFIYQYNCGKKKMAICGTSLLLLFHSTAIISLLFLIACSILGDKRIEKGVKFGRKRFLIFIVVACIVRVVAFQLMNLPFVVSILTGILSVHASPTPVLFSAGIMARMVFLILISFMFYIEKSQNKSIIMLYGCYFVGMLLYICIPLDFVMGRLMNNIHILSSVLIPEIYFNNVFHKNLILVISKSKEEKIKKCY